jgi:hypothetical protein
VAEKLTFPDRGRHGDDAVRRRLAVQTTDEIGEVVKDGKIVLHGHDIT